MYVNGSYDLADSITARNARENRFVEWSANDFELVAFAELSDQVEILWPVLDEPFQQATGIVERYRQRRKFSQQFQKRRVAVLKRPMKDIVEIADRLVIVNDQGQAKLSHWVPSMFFWLPQTQKVLIDLPDQLASPDLLSAGECSPQAQA